jgi:P21-Rho-binding domain
MPKWIDSLFVRQRLVSTQNEMEIGMPTGSTHDTHVAVNAFGDLEGLPEEWKKLLDTMVTAAEQKAHPDAAFQAVKYYQNHHSEQAEDLAAIRRKKEIKVRSVSFELYFSFQNAFLLPIERADRCRVAHRVPQSLQHGQTDGSVCEN